MSLFAGTRLGPYEIRSILGAGGMGEVYRARDTKLNREVALKVLPEAFTRDPDRVARFKREAQVLASLNHPHIGAIYGFEDSGETHALVLELVEGDTLADRITRGLIPLDCFCNGTEEADVRIQRIAILLVIALQGAQAGAQPGASKPDRFAALRFLAGTWRGDQAGQPGRGTAERTYQFILNDRFLQETNTSTYPPQEKNKNGEVHHHMSMISFDTARKLFVFRQFHTEGFVNTYVQQPTADDKAILFVSEAIENIPAGYRARETYTILSRDEFTERFEIAEPGKDFELYSETRLKRVR